MSDIGCEKHPARLRHLLCAEGYPKTMAIPAVLLSLLMALTPASSAAQALAPASKGQEKDAPVPKAYLPPAGMCRIWVDNVPAARQPAPTDCATAIRNKPPNARVIFPTARPGDAKGLTPNRPRPDTTKRKPPS